MKKEEPEEKPEPMEVEEKKPDIKTESKEEEEGGANSTTSSSPLQSRRKSKRMLLFFFCMGHPRSISGSAVGSKSGISSIFFPLNVFLVFKPEELRQALMPTLESLYRQDPESLPFRQPVDPMLLGIPVRHALAHSGCNS